MPRIISVHEYVLQPDVSETEFEKAIKDGRERALLQLPGLTEFHFLRGIRGARQGQYAAVWVYESREAWEKLWGPPEQPKDKSEYPEAWKIWEDQILAPFLDHDPDKIRFTAYEEF